MPPADTHTSERERILRFWLPSFTDWLFYFVISTVWFGVTNATTLWQFFNLRVLGADLSVSSDYSPLTAPFFDFINDHDTWVMLLIWGVIGGIVFGLVLVFQNIFKTARQELAESRYLVGGVNVNPQYWHSVARLDISFAGMAIGWIVYLVLYLNVIMGWVARYFFGALDSSWHNGYKLLIALAVNTVAIYILFKFTRILVDTWKLIRPDN